MSQIYFWNRTPHVSYRFSVHLQESAVYTATGICHTEILKMGKNFSTTYTYRCVYSTRLLKMDRKSVQNM